MSVHDAADRAIRASAAAPPARRKRAVVERANIVLIRAIMLVSSDAFGVVTFTPRARRARAGREDLSLCQQIIYGRLAPLIPRRGRLLVRTHGRAESGHRQGRRSGVRETASDYITKENGSGVRPRGRPACPRK